MFCEKNHIILKYSADILSNSNLEFSTLAGVPIAEIKKTKLDGWGKIFKRLSDILLSFILLIILIPIFLIIFFVIKIDSKGPIFYASKRVGAKGEKIRIWKFRSMVIGAENMKNKLLKENERTNGPLFKMENDPRVTKVGKFIRRLSIDELPQLWNVLKGNMSLVGPRPHEPNEVEKYKDYQFKLLNIKPGMTGMAQVSGRSDLNFEDEVRLDIFYIENWSPKLDLIILLKTPWVVLARKGAK
jgi:exopolysaccharide biosynthesis polyprenyl glycosylphosphotransferase